MLQAIDRLRLIHSPRKKTVIILCNIPLDIPVDALVTWRELVGGGRLAQALEAGEENGGEGLPLAGKGLTPPFPEVWGAKKGAEDLGGEKPAKPIISIFRRLGVLNIYRRPGQTSWSKALVRHGADPRAALANVLGVPAGDIRLRDCSE